MHTYKAIQQGEGAPFVLEKDGRNCSCPKTGFVMPQQVQSGLNKGQIIPMPGQFNCTTSCPFATLDKREKFEEAKEGGGSKSVGEKDIYCIGCESGNLFFWLDEVVPFQKMGTIMQPAK